MRLEEAQALKVGDLVRYKEEDGEAETLEVVTAEWGTDRLNQVKTPRVIRLQTVAVITQSEDDDIGGQCFIGEEGWINEYNVACFEKIA